MASYTTITLDTTVPAGVTVSINSGDGTTTSRDVTLTIATSDSPTTGYQMKIYGDVDDSFDTANYRTLEANAPWISYATSKSVRLTAGDGSKTVRIKIRDDVGNASAESTDVISLDTTVPVVTVGAPSVTKISKISTFDTVTFAWTSDIAVTEYKVKVVPATNSTHTQGTQLGTAAGSANVAGVEAISAGAGKTTTVKGADLETASAGDGDKIIKVFVKNSAGTWSV
jgi:hypothetical protein